MPVGPAKITFVRITARSSTEKKLIGTFTGYSLTGDWLSDPMGIDEAYNAMTFELQKLYDAGGQGIKKSNRLKIYRTDYSVALWSEGAIREPVMLCGFISLSTPQNNPDGPLLPRQQLEIQQTGVCTFHVSLNQIKQSSSLKTSNMATLKPAAAADLLQPPAPAPKGEVKTILLSLIKPDPGQPRKFFDPTGMEELTASVKRDGILQDIMVRPDPKKSDAFLIVYGERRYRAACAAGLVEIQAEVRIMSDDEAHDLQVVENLQRRDVHALEEAAAFLQMIKSKTRKSTPEEIAARYGKTVYYVRQRLKLNDLSDQWQAIFIANKMTVTQALLLCVLPDKEQGELYTRNVRAAAVKESHWLLDLDEDDVERVQRKLNKAPFDTKDPALNPKMGACTNCPFNTAVGSLFPDQEKDPTCTNASCFTIKCNRSFDITLKSVLNDPAVILVQGSYSSYSEPHVAKQIEKLEKAGNKIYIETTYNSGPKYCEEVSKNIKGFKELLEVGKILKGFVLSGDDRGTFSYFKLRPGNASSGSSTTVKPADKIKSGKFTNADIDKEIERIKGNQARKKEIDFVTVHKNMQEIVNELIDDKAWSVPGFKMQPIDRGIMVFMLMELGNCEYEINDLGIVPEEPSDEHYKYSKKYFEDLCKVTDEQLAFIIRHLVNDKFGPPKEYKYGISVGDTAYRIMAEYMGVDVKDLEKQQEELATDRNANYAKKIAALEKKKKPAPAAKDPATPKPKKKAAPKKKASK